MVKVKKAEKKGKKIEKAKKEVESEDEGGTSLDDAFADDEDVEYAPNKPKKVKKKIEEEIEEVEEEVEKISNAENNNAQQEDVEIKASKPIVKVKKGDRIKVDGKDYTVDAHYILIDHGTTKEMAIECYDSNDKDYQLRYFADQIETTMEFYELQEILFVKRIIKRVEW